MKNRSDKDIRALYSDLDIGTMQAAEGSCMPGKSRVEEIARFAGLSGFTNIGIAYCHTFSQEALTLKAFLEVKGFSVVICGCKTGKIPKTAMLGRGRGTSCNPVLQAKELADSGTELNIVMGLCMGHDILFSRYSKAPSTTLLIKDRKNGHDPLKFFKSRKNG